MQVLLQFTSNYGRLAYDAVLSMAHLLNLTGAKDTNQMVIDDIAFYGASVSWTC